MNKAELNGVSPWFVECFEIVQLSFTSSATHSNFLSAARSHEADFCYMINIFRTMHAPISVHRCDLSCISFSKP